MINIVLARPEIPPNTGNVIRLAANCGASLHLVGPMGFGLNHSRMRRAGLDYHEIARLTVHTDWQAFIATVPAGDRLFAITTRGQRNAFDASFGPGDWLIFGSETRGLDQAELDAITPANWLRLPMRPGNRSMNLSNAVAVLAYEAWRQQGFPGGS